MTRPSPPILSLGATILLFTASFSGCGPRSPSAVRTLVRDSAGITIVESSALPDAGAEGWALDQEPFLTIGTFQGDTLYQLYQISGGTRLPDGRIVLSDQGSFQIRVFGPDGTFQRSLGREGEGPGEFRSVRLMGVLGKDSLVVMDGRLRRISIFHPDEGYLGQSTVEEDVGPVFVSNGMFRDGSIVFGGGWTFGPGDDAPSDGLNRSDTPYRSAALDGSLAADFGSIPGAEMFMRTQGSGGEFFISATTIPFGRRPVANAGGDRLFLGSGDRYEIGSFDPSGRPDRIIRVLQPLPPVTSQDVDGLIEERIAELEDPSGGPGLRSSLREMPRPETMPAYQNLKVDALGFLWVEDFRRPGEGLRSWAVFDREGTPRTRLSLPHDNRVLEIGPDHVMAVFEDALGVEYLRLYSLSRGS